MVISNLLETASVDDHFRVGSITFFFAVIQYLPATVRS